MVWFHGVLSWCSAMVLCVWVPCIVNVCCYCVLQLFHTIGVYFGCCNRELQLCVLKCVCVVNVFYCLQFMHVECLYGAGCVEYAGGV